MDLGRQAVPTAGHGLASGHADFPASHSLAGKQGRLWTPQPRELAIDVPAALVDDLVGRNVSRVGPRRLEVGAPLIVVVD